MSYPSLQQITAQLEAWEETIIHKLIERAQFARNQKAYVPASRGSSEEDSRSFFDRRLRKCEEMDAEWGRFCMAEERPFTSPPLLSQHKVIRGDGFLNAAAVQNIDVTGQLLTAYLLLLDQLCRVEHDGHDGSSVEHDIYALQAISRRIHHGACYVAERKFRDDPTTYTALIRAGEQKGLENALIRKEVEERIIRRVGDKTDAIQSLVTSPVREKISTKLIQDFYRHVIIDLTLQGEIDYLLGRAG